jgi:hypothetical protein
MHSAEMLKFNAALFWDVSVESLDIDAHCRFIIERVVSRGGMTDWILLKEIYGIKRISDEVLSVRSLDRKTVSFLSLYFGKEKTDFRCCS